MPIELTTASEETLDAIRASLAAASIPALSAEAAARTAGDDALADSVEETGETVDAVKTSIRKGVAEPAFYRIDSTDDFEVQWISSPDIPVRMSNQPDGSAGENTLELVHPSVVHIPGGWRGWPWWMAVTTYPVATKGDAEIWENPSILVSDNGIDWIEHPGLSNPIAPCPAASSTQGDVGLCYDPDADRLIIVYVRTTPSVKELRLIQSTDGVAWSAPVVVKTQASLLMTSPNLVRVVKGGVVEWRLYFNRSDLDGGFRLRFCLGTDPVNATQWLAASETVCTITGLGSGRIPWDFQMYWSGSQYIYLPTVSVGFGGSFTRPVLGTSSDGTTFACGTPIARRTPVGQRFDLLIYTTAITLMGTGEFLVISSGQTSGVGWRLRIGLLKKRTGIPAQAQQVFGFDHRYNITPASGTVTAAGASTSEGVVAATVADTPTRSADGITFDGVGEYCLWSDKSFLKQPQFTAIISFRMLLSAGSASGNKVVFLLGTVLLLAVPVAGKWQLHLRDFGGITILVPQLIDANVDLTVAISWDGTVARFGSSLIDDYGGSQEGALTGITMNGDLWLGAGLNSGTPGGVLIKQFRLFDRATTSNLEGIAKSFA
jgi:hypothetical protein